MAISTETSVSTRVVSRFLDRYDAVVWRVRIGHALVAVFQTLLVALAGFALLTVADFLWELGPSTRWAGRWAITVVTAVIGWRAALRFARHCAYWNSAAELEYRHPELGQSLRTTLQFGRMTDRELHQAGASAALVGQLSSQTDWRTRDLPLEAIVPRWRLGLMIGGCVALAALFAGLGATRWEWRYALGRSAGQELPYRLLELPILDQQVHEGGAVRVEFRVIGRPASAPAVFTRAGQRLTATGIAATAPAASMSPAETVAALASESPEVARSQESTATNAAKGKSASKTAAAAVIPEWHQRRPQRVAGDPLHGAEVPSTAFAVTIPNVHQPFDYYVTADALQSSIGRVDVIRPLRLQALELTLTPPAYTGLPTETAAEFPSGVLVGTEVAWNLQYDKPLKRVVIRRDVERAAAAEPNPAAATTPGNEAAAAKTEKAAPAAPSETFDIEMTIDGMTATWRETVTQDIRGSVLAEAIDGTVAEPRLFRIRVREDAPPTVAFEEPSEELEVHALAEVPLRVRVRDDFGISRAGIVFQINTEPETVLITQEFPVKTAADGTLLVDAEHIQLTAQAMLERLLPLEHFELSQKDSVQYFAFAEDNRPSPQRVETDIRFIDIRPFRRTYREDDGEAEEGMPGRRLKFLEELIQRQRFALNRTVTFEKRANVGRAPDINGINSLIAFETEIAQSTRDLADFLISRAFDNGELLTQAESAMRQAVDSISVSNWEIASEQMRDALKLLIEQRERAAVLLAKKPTPETQELMRFNRVQLQRLRRPKSDAELAREVVQRLAALAAEEAKLANELEEEFRKTPPPVSLESGPGEGQALNPSPMYQPPANQPQSKEPSKKLDADASSQSNSGSNAEGETPAAATNSGQPNSAAKPDAGEQGNQDQPATKGENQTNRPEGENSITAANPTNPEGQPSNSRSRSNSANRSTGEDNDAMNAGESGPGTRTPGQRLEAQGDAAAEARDIQRGIGKLEKATEETKNRIKAAADKIEASLKAMQQGDAPGAQQNAEQAAADLGDLGRLVEGLTQADAPARLAAARDVAQEVSRLERQFQRRIDERLAATPMSSSTPMAGTGTNAGTPRPDNQPPQNNAAGGARPSENQPSPPPPNGSQSGAGNPQESQPNSKSTGGGNSREPQQNPTESRDDNPGGSGPSTRKQPSKENPAAGDADPDATLQEQAERIAARAALLRDLLRGIAAGTGPDDKSAAQTAQELLRESNLERATNELRQSAAQAGGDKPDLKRLQQEAQEMAGRFDLISQQLESATRALVNPQAEALAKIEQALAGLRDRFDELQTVEQAVEWHRELDELLSQLEGMGVDLDRDELVRELQQLTGWGTAQFRALTKQRLGLVVGDTNNTQLNSLLARVQDKIQERIQTLLVGEIASGADSTAPPKYRELVERYFEVLSTRNRQRQAAPKEMRP